MKALIYQYWDGNVKESARIGARVMAKYAERIGADHLFEENPQWAARFKPTLGNAYRYYGCFRPVFDEQFDDYDAVLFCDTDVFPIDGLEENIFDEIGDNHLGICTEPFQPKQRLITTGRITSQQDELWAKTVENKYNFKVPRTEDGLVEVYNTGVVLYSREGIEYARKNWPGFKDYINTVKRVPLDSFYHVDQPYLHCVMFASGMRVLELNNGWNSYIHGTRDIHHKGRRILDWRDESTKFVHCQFPGADDLDEETLLRIVNRPRSEWGYDIT